MTNRDDTAATCNIAAAGDTTLVVTLGQTLDRAVSRRVLRLADQILSSRRPGVREVVPTAAALAVHFDPDVVTADELTRDLARWADAHPAAAGSATVTAPRQWSIPVCYEREVADDLDAVAAATGLGRDEVIGRHAAATYYVYMLGFLPGFPYMGDLDPRLVLPRRATPRTRVAAGAVAVAGAMTAIYPAESPGGWHILGRSPVRLFDPARASPSLLGAGDLVTFRPITLAELERLWRAPDGGARGAEA